MMIRWGSGECQVNVRWMSGERQISIWAWHWWTWNLSQSISDREFSVLFKILLTFYSSFLVNGVITNQNIKSWATSFALVGCIIFAILMLSESLLNARWMLFKCSLNTLWMLFDCKNSAWVLKVPSELKVRNVLPSCSVRDCRLWQLNNNCLTMLERMQLPYWFSRTSSSNAEKWL